MKTYTRTPLTRIKRLPKRGSYDRDSIHAIIDEALICHVGFTLDDQPCVIPTAIMRQNDCVYIHGSRVSRMLKHLAEGAPACIVVTHLDGLVLARSGFHSSMNYRSVVIYGNARVVDKDRKRELLDRFVDSLIPGRVADIRPPTRKEINATTLLEFDLDQVSAKIRSAPPADDAEDYDAPVWAGVLPLALIPGQAETDPDMRRRVPVPGYVKAYRR